MKWGTLDTCESLSVPRPRSPVARRAETSTRRFTTAEDRTAGAVTRFGPVFATAETRSLSEVGVVAGTVTEDGAADGIVDLLLTTKADAAAIVLVDLLMDGSSHVGCEDGDDMIFAQ